jgi:CRP/FNR family cyclic AMP-dependent transcriptional regulator
MVVEMAAARVSENKIFASGEVIFGQGDLGDAAYIVEEGEVAIFQVLGDEMYEIGIIHPGEMFGEMSMIDGGRRMATAIACRRTNVKRIPKTVFDRKLHDADLFVKGILKFFLRHIRSSHQNTQVKPRSLRDQMRYLKRTGENLRNYVGQVEDATLNAELSAAFTQLDAAISRVEEATENVPDSRHDVVMAAQVGAKFYRGIASSKLRNDNQEAAMAAS